LTGYMYILKCVDYTYYTGSTKNLKKRLWEHQNGEGANYTRKRLPVELVYFEEYSRIDEAFYREKQVQGWNRKKKEALIRGDYDMLPALATAYRDLKAVASSASATGVNSVTKKSRCLRHSKSAGRRYNLRQAQGAVYIDKKYWPLGVK